MKGISFALVLCLVGGSAYSADLGGIVIGGERVLPPRLDLCAGPGSPGIAGEILNGGMPAQEADASLRPLYSQAREGAMSFLLPGLGQLRMGRTVRAKIYFGLEGLAWIAMGGYIWQGYSRENSFKDYAVAYADVTSTDRSDEYWEHIGGYMSNEGPRGYNEYVRREARDLYYPDTAAMDAYYISNSYSGAMSWRWRSESVLELYNVLRDGSKSSYRRALYSLVFALSLRVVSTVDAVRIARIENAAAAAAEGGISLELESRHQGFSIAVKKSF